MAGKMRRAYDRTVRNAKNEEGIAQLNADLDASIIAAGRHIADHLDGVSDELEKAMAHAIETLNNDPDADATQVSRALEAVDKISERAGKAIYLTPHLMNILREMFATPKSRAELLAKGDTRKGELPNGTLGKLQGLRGGKSA